jgi:uncharacterized membrane protein
MDTRPVSLLLPIHIVAAAVALVSGAIALAAAKGRIVHRRSGMVFVYAMIAMCVSAVMAAIVKGQAVNVMAGTMTAYLVMTGMRTVRPRSAASRRGDIALMSMALALGAAALAAGVAAVATPHRTMFGVPAFPFFLFGVLGLSGGAGDARVMRSGSLRGAPRLARHLWRMCMALFIAAASFFSIRSRVAAIFPAAMTGGVARTIPVLLVLATMVYWLWRIRSRALPPPVRT